jgi:MFS family permease
LPSLVSKTAPSDLRGTAMGIYSTCQFMGAGLGGAAGGWFYGHYGVEAVFLFCAAAAFSWFLVSLTMKPPRHLANLLISIERINGYRSDEFISGLLRVAGIEEVTVHTEEAVAYLKVDNQRLDRNQLQQFLNQFGNA